MCRAFSDDGEGHLVFFPIQSPETKNEAPIFFTKACCDTGIDRSLAHSFTSSVRIRAYEGVLLGVLGVLALALQQLVSE